MSGRIPTPYWGLSPLPARAYSKAAKILSVCILVFAFIFMVGTDRAVAGPEDGVVAGGSITINQIDSTTTVIHQASDRGIIDWRRFDVNTNELVEFKQPSVQAITVNRVKNSTEKTTINGTIKANGNVVILNENGVLFGESSRVDVGGLTASTSNLADDAEFMAGGAVRFKAGNSSNVPNAKIENRGTITAREGGLVGLVSPHTENNGLIQARLGKVQMASGDIATIDFAGDGLIQLDISTTVTRQIIKNQGVVSADGGRVLITAAAGRQVVDSVISVSGVVQARSVGGLSGKITIEAKGSNKSVKTGNSYIFTKDVYIDVSGRKAGEKGGDVRILADQIILDHGTFIDASGANANINGTNFRAGSAAYTSDSRVRSFDEFMGHNYRAGGSVMIGGDYLGLGTTQTAKNLVVDKNVYVFNDALLNGDAGRTIFWSDGTTDFRGNVFSRGGVTGGHGGFLETSGKDRLKAVGFADLTNRDFRFRKGTYLLDPTDITIYGNVAPNFASSDGTSINLAPSLKLWLDASDALSITASGGLVSQWNDKSGNNNHAAATGTNRPVTGVGTLNGLNVIRFDGVDDFLTILDAPSLDFSTAFSYFGVNRVAVRSPIADGILSKRISSGSQEAYSIFYFTGFNLYTDIDSSNNRFGGNTVYSLGQANQNSVFYNGSASAANRVQIYDRGLFDIFGTESSASIPNYSSNLIIGMLGSNTSTYLNGDISEILLYDTALSGNARNLIDQYQSAKWGLALDPLAGAGSEAVEAMASIQKGDAADGYSVFTTRYLERLSLTADISLRSSNNITLDLKGDDLNLSTAGRSITLQAGNQILTASAGSITTNNGGITMIAPSGILFSHNFTLNSNGGAINLNNNVTIGTGANLTINGGTANNTIASVIAGAGALTKAGTGGLTLSGLNTYSGGTTVSAGILNANINTTQSAIGTGAASVASGATLNLNNLNASGTPVTISNGFTGAGTLGVTFATAGAARNTFIGGLTGFTGNVALSTPRNTGDKLVLSSN